MADSILRSKITFGDSDRVEAAKLEGKINEFDVLCLDGDTKPKMGWLDRDGNTRIVEPGMSETEVVTKVEASIEESKAYADEKVTASIEESKAYADEKVVAAVEESKAYADEKVETVVEEKLSESVDEKVSEKIDSALVAYSANKYEITDAPEGTLVNYGEHEIRILIPANATFTKQAVGTGGDPNSYYVTLKTYFTDDEIVGYREHLGTQVDAEILKDIKTDANGRRYQPSWLAVAKYDDATDTWTYYGASSSENKYIGWDYRIDKYDANDVMIASDFVRINLSNEDCHFSLAPSYLNGAVTEANAYTDKKIAEVANGYEIVEF